MTVRFAIAGRPNVGKSTLFNRLVGKKLALVDDTPGVTRDRREGDAKLGDLNFKIIDTAGMGFEGADDPSLEGRMRAQADQAIESAAAVIFVYDARAGVAPLDEHFGEVLRKTGKPVILAANKAEGASAESGLLDGHSLGFGEPIAISAEHGLGMADLYQALRPYFDEPEFGEAEDAFEDDLEDEDGHFKKPIQLAVIGRPNAGKSTLINRIIGEERLLTGPEAGITRDSISVDWNHRGQAYKIFDTAGLRKRAKVQGKLEKLSAGDALRAVQFAHVVILLLDADIPFEKQDLHIADLTEREGRALVIVLNKWDQIEDGREAYAELREKCTRLLPQVSGVPLVTASGLYGEGIDAVFKAVKEQYRVWNQRISTARLNQWLDEALQRHPPPAVSGRRIKLRYLTQSKSRPPTFAVFCSRPDALPAAYKRYLVNTLREDFGFRGVPIRLMLRKSDNPYAPKKKRKIG